MKQALLVVDVQPSFDPPPWLVDRCQALASSMPSVASVHRYDEQKVPFYRQIGWTPRSVDDALVRDRSCFPQIWVQAARGCNRYCCKAGR